MRLVLCLLGFSLIWCIFYFKFTSYKRLVLFLGVLIIFCGMFLNNVFIKNISVNICFLVGYLLILFSVIPLRLNSVLNALDKVGYGVILYICLNIVSLDFNLFFNWIPLVIIVIVFNGFNSEVDNCFFGLNLTFGLCEIFNLFFISKKMNFSIIFSFEFVNCFVIGNSVMLLLFFILKIFKRKRYEKVC